MTSPATFAKVSRFFTKFYGRVFSANPYPLYRFLRTRFPLLKTPIGFWIVTTYADSVAITRDKRFNAFDLGALDAFPPEDGLLALRPALQHAIVFHNPPDHTRIRKVMGAFFTPAVLNTLKPRIQKIVDDLLDKVQDRGSMDLISDFAFPFPIDVLTEVLGGADEDKPMFHEWMQALGVPLDPVMAVKNPGAKVSQALESVQRYYGRLAVERRKHPREDLFSMFVAGQDRGDLQSEKEVSFNAVFTMIAGHETTMNMIGNGMLALLRHPEALARLRKDPSLIDAALDEIFRYDSPSQLIFRTASEDIEVGGKIIPKGDHAVIVAGAANRDPAHFADPDKFDLDRPNNHHNLSFSAGVHRCVGEPLARIEGRIAFETILRRMPNLALATPNPKWRTLMALRGLETLPLVF